jgi:GT2 family glycosyltransferase
MCIRRDVFEKIHGFDEDFILYAEETDLCLRIRKEGFKIGYYDEVSVKHIGGASEKRNPPAEVIKKKKRGKYLFYTKHYSKNDVIKLIHADFRHARFHLIRLWIQKKILALSKKNEQKYVRHKVSYQLAKEFLNS